LDLREAGLQGRYLFHPSGDLPAKKSHNRPMSGRFLLAPMAELSHRALRELLEGFGGWDEYFTEMISSGALISGGPFEAWYTDNGPRPDKLVYQLVGGDEERLADAAGLLDRRDCLGIDLNMGCAAPAITKTGAGVRWMASIDRAASLAARVRGAVKRRLSVKLRLGFSDNFDYLVQFCRRLEDAGVELITLHPRTSTEKFRGRARRARVAALARELRVPVVGNGDISSGVEFRRLAAEWGAAMAGRLAVREPWALSRAQAQRQQSEAGRAELTRETGLRFLELVARYQPPEFHLSRARRFFNFFCDNLFWANHVKILLNREQSLAGMERVWEEHFRNVNDGRP
jgi:tRNA-dihydrouridine synthase